MSEIRINFHEDGRMVVRLGAFFPCAQHHLRRLLAVVDMDWRRRDEIVQEIETFLKEKARETRPYDAKYAARLEKNLETVEQWKQTRK